MSYAASDGSRKTWSRPSPVEFRYGMGKAKLRVRMALPDESAMFAEAKNNGQPSDELMLVYLVELDGEEPPVDPGAFPPTRT
jgi:hypothetical protein